MTTKTKIRSMQVAPSANVPAKPQKFTVAEVRTAKADLIAGIAEVADQWANATKAASTHLMETAARLARVPALQGLTLAQYEKDIAPGIAKQIEKLPIASKSQYRVFVRTMVLGAANGVSGDAFRDNAKVAAKLRALKVLPTSNRGRKTDASKGKGKGAVGAATPSTQGAGPPLAASRTGPGKVITRDDLLACAAMLLAAQPDAPRVVALVNLCATKEGRADFGKYLDNLSK